MKKVILAGFQPFGDYLFNPTEECARYFGDIEIVSNINIIGVVLPCTYFGAFQVLTKIIKDKYYEVIELLIKNI